MRTGMKRRRKQYAAEFGGRAYSDYADMLQDSEIAAVSICTPLESVTQGVSHWVYGDSHYSQLADFVEAIHSGREPMVTGEDSRHALELLLAVYRSQESGQSVRLPLS